MKNNKLVILGILLGLLGLSGVLVLRTLMTSTISNQRQININSGGIEILNGGIEILNIAKPPPNIPLVNNNNQPLPHNGLFIRRNNQFGTRLNVGIKDLIEQGVLFEQRNIRFDDFITLNSEGIPLPKSDNSLAVNYGITPIPQKQKRNQRATHYL
ncbi:MAG: hypothetical protein F6K22_26755 [Okeania sp. SIO2F4]|uniref:hypothetical protein n=1 Tax=Okeania sp. SIO2F4 TaxID=2607790 RepID=UPI00142A24B0|nr:hypothetical protein [Okeania sp. SIO2F4]NES06090.1 hypothetical protein [Okeania sp. SIO2F4]